MRIACALVLLAARLAHADDKPDPDAWYPRVSAGAGLGYHVGDLATLTASGPNLAAQAALKVRPAVFLDALFDYAPSATARDERKTVSVDVASTTVGLAVRTPLMSFGDKPRGFGGDLFVSGGIAREWVRWSGGGLTRNVLALGFGTTVIVPSRAVHQHVRLGFRMLFARAPEPAKRPAGCDGPCDTATATEPYDMSIVTEVSCHFGH